MESKDRAEQRDDAADQATQADGDMVDADTAVDLPSTTIVGANILASNTAPYPGGVVAPAAELADEEAAAEGVGPLNLDALEQFASKGRETADEGVSTAQSEQEADETNG